MPTRSKTHPGVSIQALARSRFRLRWRERSTEDSHEAQSWTCTLRDRTEAERWAIEIYRSLQSTGTFQRPVDVGLPAPVPVRPQQVDLRDLWVAYASWRISHKRIRPSTATRDRELLAAAERAIRAVHRLPDHSPIPLALLDTWTCEQMVGYLQRRGNGSSRQSSVMATVYHAWVWASDDEGDRWPGLRSAPRTRSKVVPARHEPPPGPAPTLAEMDALVREARRCKAPSCAGDLLEVMRGTGLRISQVCALRVCDVKDLDGPRPQLHIRKGKSRHEAGGRAVPLAPCLGPLFRRRCAGRRPGDPVLPSRPGADTLAAVVERCLARGEVRPEVIQPDGRGNRRTSHSMRAGLQRYLRRQRVEDRVIDLLVGHKGATVRDRHYDIADWTEVVAAVARIPPVLGEGWLSRRADAGGPRGGRPERALRTDRGSGRSARAGARRPRERPPRRG